MSDQACCSHSIVRHHTVSNGDGTMCEEWRCRDCGHPFTPRFHTLLATPTPPAAEGDWIHANSMLAVIDASVRVRASKTELVASLRALPRVSRDSATARAMAAEGLLDRAMALGERARLMMTANGRWPEDFSVLLNDVEKARAGR
jgi:hypothetical protein